jgi:paraquat-inducible protein B
MSKKANFTAIGFFVIGAILLAVAGIVIFGSGKFFEKKYNYVAYFTGSVKGLNVGAPVLWNGVQVGEVTKIALEFDAKEMAMRIAVVFQMSRGNSEVVNREYYEGITKATQDEILIDLINRGLRAQLAPQSVITGLLYVKLDFFPETKGILYGAETMGRDIEVTEIPTVPSDMEELARTFENLPLQQIAQNLEDMTAGIEQVVNSPQIAAILSSVEGATATLDQTMINLNTQLASLAKDLKSVIRNTDRVMRKLDQQIEPVTQGVITTADAATQAFHQAEETLSLAKGPGAELVADIRQAVDAATQALNQANTTMQTIDTLADEDSEVVYTLNTALEEIAMAARSIRTVAEYLERHPESLLRGKGGK